MKVGLGGLGLEVKTKRLIELRAGQKVEKIRQDLENNAPSWSGNLKKNIKTVKTGWGTWEIFPDVDYAWYAENGNHANSPDGLIHKKGYGNGGMPITAKGDSSRTAIAYRKAVRPHKGSHFVRNTASKYK